MSDVYGDFISMLYVLDERQIIENGGALRCPRQIEYAVFYAGP